MKKVIVFIFLAFFIYCFLYAAGSDEIYKKRTRGIDMSKEPDIAIFQKNAIKLKCKEARLMTQFPDLCGMFWDDTGDKMVVCYGQNSEGYPTNWDKNSFQNVYFNRQTDTIIRILNITGIIQKAIMKTGYAVIFSREPEEKFKLYKYVYGESEAIEQIHGSMKKLGAYPSGIFDYDDKNKLLYIAKRDKTGFYVDELDHNLDVKRRISEKEILGQGAKFEFGKKSNWIYWQNAAFDGLVKLKTKYGLYTSGIAGNNAVGIAKNMIGFVLQDYRLEDRNFWVYWIDTAKNKIYYIDHKIDAEDWIQILQFSQERKEVIVRVTGDRLGRLYPLILKYY
jgi:hypothetical protein